MGKFINGETNYVEWRDHSKDNKKYLERMAVIVMVIALKVIGFADELKLVAQIIVSAMTGKLEGYFSLSTSVLMNKRCQARAKIKGSICAACYAASTASRNSGLCQALETNYIILNNFLISEAAWATLVWKTTNGDARIESFGDVDTVTCARNYIRIVKTHPWLNFGAWTKDVDIWIEAFILEGGKPKNIKFIVSSFMINVKMKLKKEWLPYIDHRFTVYTKEYAEANGIEINCGGLKCLTCRKCYGDGPFDIAELEK